MRLLAVTTSDPQQVRTIKTHLESLHVLNKLRKIERVNSVFRIYTLVSPEDTILDSYNIEEYEQSTNEDNTLSQHIKSYLINVSISSEKLDSLVFPKKWDVYPPMVLFLAYAFEGWNEILDDKEGFYNHILKYFPSCTHIALNRPIEKFDVMRRPWNITPLYGDFGCTPQDNSSLDDPYWDTTAENYKRIDFKKGFWVSVIQNGIVQNWAPMYTMFLRGNIKEKKRVLEMPNVKNSVVFDLYCGIGYFLLSYLAQGCDAIFCWDINPWLIEGFRRSLSKYPHEIFTKHDAFDWEYYKLARARGIKVFIFCELNEYVKERLLLFSNTSLDVKHINLGLLPTLRDTWETSKEIIERMSNEGCVHIHENVHKDEFERFIHNVEEKFGPSWSGKHLEKVKTFAPDVWHVVLDLEYHQQS